MPLNTNTTGNSTTAAMVTIRTAETGAAVYPPLSGLNVLTAREVVAADARSPLRLKWETGTLFTPGEDLAGTPCATGPLPLAPLAAELVRAAGGKVRMPAPAPWVPAALDPQLCPDAGMIRAIAREPWLIVRYNPQSVDRLRLAVQIPLAFKDKTVAVVAKTEGQVDAFAAMAREAGLDVTTFSGPRQGEFPRPRIDREGALRNQVAVGTFAGLAHDDALLQRRDIVIVLDVLEGLEKRALTAIECARPGRLVGLLSDKARVPAADLDRLTKIYGLAEVRVGRHGVTDRAVVYGSVPYKGSGLKPGLSPAKVKELGVWSNLERNRRIADVATALCAGDRRAIANLLPKGLGNKLPSLTDRAGGGYRVAVVVENATHGNTLLSMLPGWAGTGRGLRPGPSSGRTTPGWGQPPGANRDNVVCTFDGLKKIPLGEFDVVIRADGGTGPLPGSIDVGSADPKAKELVFVDIDDRFHRELERNGRKRRAAYRRLGWQSIAESVEFDQLRRYLARHPRGDAIHALLKDVKQSGNTSDASAEGDANVTIGTAEPIVLALLQPSTALLTLSPARPRRLPPNPFSGYSRRRRSGKKNSPLKVLEGRGDYLPPFADIVGPDNLYAVLHEMMNAGAGPGAGEDGIGLYDLSPREWATHLRDLSRRVFDSAYSPEPTKLVKVPKPDGKFRPIEVGTVADRVLAGALNRALAPHLDAQLLNNSYGFRPNRSHWDALAAVKIYIEATGIIFAVIDDVKQAFPSVRHDPLLEDVTRLINGSKPANYDPAPLLNLLEAIVRGRDARHHPQKGVGITQGCPLSPLFLNTHMHPRHDLAVDRERALIPFWARYADNLLYMVKNETDGVEALELVRQLLQGVGLDLKGQKGEKTKPTDLNVRPVELLGFSMKVNNRNVVLGIPDDAWKNLREALQEAHRTDEPGKQAKSIIIGWTEACGPAVENRVETTHQTILDTVKENGFKGIISPEGLFKRLEDSRDRWKGRLERALLQGRGF